MQRSPITPLPFASVADVAKAGDGVKSALREIFFCQFWPPP
jgi:hypothetical protein